MAKTRKYLHAFSGGEISPEMIGRIDDIRHQTGAARMLNMFCKPHGPVQRRPGFERVAACYKNSNAGTRVLPFRFSDTQSLVVEMGYDSALSHGYFRFHSDGDPVTFTPNPGGDPILTEDVQVFRTALDAVVYTTAGPPYSLVVGVPRDATDDADINLATDEFSMNGDWFQTGDQIAFYSSAANPGGVSAGTNYYVIRTTPNVIQLALTYADALDGTEITITTKTSGATLYWGRPDMMQAGDAVRIDAGGVPPAGLDEDTTYYVRSNAEPEAGIIWNLYRSREGAINKWSTDLVALDAAILFAARVTYTAGFTRRYRSGELVEDTRGGGSYYTAREEFSVDSLWDVSDWLLQEADNIYTIESPFTTSQLFEVDKTQANDVMSLTHRGAGKYELRRLAADWWELAQVALTDLVEPPSNVVATPDYGRRAELYDIGVATANARAFTGDGVTAVGPPDIPLVDYDEVHIVMPGITIDKTAFGGGATEPLDHDFVVLDSTSGSPNVYFEFTHEENGVAVLASEIGGTAVPPGYATIVPLGEIADNYYVITAVAANDIESTQSAEATTENNLFNQGASNTVTWSAITGAESYRVYKKKNGVFGLIGSVKATATLEFRDDNIAPDLGITPPVADTTLDEAPGVVGYFEQRRVFAATTSNPQQVWMTRSGTNSDLSYHLPLQDSDRISFVIASRQGETIRHLLPLDHLLILTDHTEYRVTPINNDAITPTTLAVRPQSFVGSSYVVPLVVGRTVLFNAARGGHVYEMGYQASVDGFQPNDVSLRATHFFDELTIKDADLQKAPYQISWWTSSSGSLLGFTYVPEQQVGGWHEHTTDGTFESVCVVPEGDEDRVYAVVLRNGTRAIERMGAMKHDSLEEGVFADSAVVYDGAPTTTITGLTHLNGSTVTALADGVVIPNQVVAGGQITLASQASKVVVGLPYTSRLTTLPLLLQVDGHGQGRTKNVNTVHVRVQESGVFDVGPTGGTLRPSDSKAHSVRGRLIADPVVTGSERVNIAGNWEDDGSVTVETARPLPLNVLGMTLEVELGG